MYTQTHSRMHRASLITGLTVYVWSLNSVAPKRENPSNLALLWALRLQQGKEVEGTGSESHFERRSPHHNLTVTMLCLHGSLFCFLSLANIFESVSSVHLCNPSLCLSRRSLRVFVLYKDKRLLMNQTVTLRLWDGHPT